MAKLPIEFPPAMPVFECVLGSEDCEAIVSVRSEH